MTVEQNDFIQSDRQKRLIVSDSQYTGEARKTLILECPFTETQNVNHGCVAVFDSCFLDQRSAQAIIDALSYCIATYGNK